MSGLMAVVYPGLSQCKHPGESQPADAAGWIRTLLPSLFTILRPSSRLIKEYEWLLDLQTGILSGTLPVLSNCPEDQSYQQGQGNLVFPAN